MQPCVVWFVLTQNVPCESQRSVCACLRQFSSRSAGGGFVGHRVTIFSCRLYWRETYIKLNFCRCVRLQILTLCLHITCKRRLKTLEVMHLYNYLSRLPTSNRQQVDQLCPPVCSIMDPFLKIRNKSLGSVLLLKASQTYSHCVQKGIKKFLNY